MSSVSFHDLVYLGLFLIALFAPLAQFIIQERKLSAEKKFKLNEQKKQDLIHLLAHLAILAEKKIPKDLPPSENMGKRPLNYVV